jgi:protein-S-isoprenylcysteine O-methyltransferase Ste14
VNLRTLQRMRVPLGFIFSIVFLIFAKPQIMWLVIGGIAAILGVSIRAWSSGHIRKNAELATSGPYAYTRNPLYVGSFVMGIGFCIAASVWWLALLFVVLFSVIYFPVMKAETKELIFHFGEKFEEYAANVPLFFPRLSAWKNSGEKFDYALYLKYREYRAIWGVLFALGILILKVFFFR